MAIYIQGFRDRLDEACADSGLTKIEIARRCGFDRKVLFPSTGQMLTSGHVARFCAVTKIDANWLLGITRSK